MADVDVNGTNIMVRVPTEAVALLVFSMTARSITARGVGTVQKEQNVGVAFS